jgi:hypothetical protein
VADPDDPIRLSDPRSQAPSELSALFREAPLELPSAARLEAMRLRLTGAPLVGPEPGASLRRSALAKAAVGALALGIAGVTAVWVAQPEVKPVPPPALSASVPETSSEPTRPPAALESAPAALESAPAALESAPKPPPALGKAKEQQQPAVAPKRTGEALLLERARRALSSDPALSLSLVRRHRSEFPNGILRQEREVIGIEALRRLGRSNEASRKADEFQRDFPNSPHGRAVERGQSK